MGCKGGGERERGGRYAEGSLSDIWGDGMEDRTTSLRVKNIWIGKEMGWRIFIQVEGRGTEGEIRWRGDGGIILRMKRD